MGEGRGNRDDWNWNARRGDWSSWKEPKQASGKGRSGKGSSNEARDWRPELDPSPRLREWLNSDQVRAITARNQEAAASNWHEGSEPDFYEQMPCEWGRDGAPAQGIEGHWHDAEEGEEGLQGASEPSDAKRQRQAEAIATEARHTKEDVRGSKCRWRAKGKHDDTVRQGAAAESWQIKESEGDGQWRRRAALHSPDCSPPMMALMDNPLQSRSSSRARRSRKVDTWLQSDRGGRIDKMTRITHNNLAEEADVGESIADRKGSNKKREEELD